jgi:hypothetical protein
VATWRITRDALDQTMSVEYQNLSTGQTFHCGTNPPGTPVTLVCDWIILNADVGDWLVFDQAVSRIQSPANA